VNPDDRPTASSFAERPAIGLLGLPLGTVTDIHATVVAKGEFGGKPGRRYILRVSEISGHALTQPRDFKFEKFSFVDVALAKDEFELYELKTGEKTGTLRQKKAAELERGYIGKKVIPMPEPLVPPLRRGMFVVPFDIMSVMPGAKTLGISRERGAVRVEHYVKHQSSQARAAGLAGGMMEW
jgi:hypothetical protein